MQSKAITVESYVNELPEDRIKPMVKLRSILKKNLPKGFKEVMSYGVVGYVVPHRLYSLGYHVDPKMTLPFIDLASQKNYIAFYHMGLYADHKMLEWFRKEYQAADIGKLDMGKSCIRFSKMDKIPFDLIRILASKITPDQWIERYDMNKLIVKKK
ncbi:MAG: DUF1801 domain-containing protein [Saprospiraceae bacterium]